jgi:hypothetical protein
MKKFILTLILFLISTSCNKYISKNIYERTYSELEVIVAYTDVYDHLYKYQLDSIPLDNWISNNLYDDTILINQKIIRKIIDDKTHYQFIFSKYIYPSTTYYQFTIRYYGKRENLQK